MNVPKIIFWVGGEHFGVEDNGSGGGGGGDTVVCRFTNSRYGLSRCKIMETILICHIELPFRKCSQLKTCEHKLHTVSHLTTHINSLCGEHVHRGLMIITHSLSLPRSLYLFLGSCMSSHISIDRKIRNFLISKRFPSTKYIILDLR